MAEFITETMQLMDLARLVYEAPVDEVIDFCNCDPDSAERCGGWYGVKRIDAFDNDNLTFLVGYYGGECNTRLYALSEYDPQIGEFCGCRLSRYDSHTGRWIGGTKNDYQMCIGRMLADFLEDYEGIVSSVITVEREVKES